MAEFRGISRAQHTALTKAVAAWERFTGDKLDTGIDTIPVIEVSQESPEAKAKQAKEELELQAEQARRREAAQQEERRLRLQPGGPLGQSPEPVLSPEAAKHQRGARRTAGEPEPVGAASDKGKHK